jgi:hypothetical protein
MNLNLLDLEAVLRRIGRGVAYYAIDEDGDPIMWDGASALEIAQLGDTEGDITVNANGTVANLTLPEISGDAVHEATATGENPTIELPLFLADPDLLPVLSPTGGASAGHIRVRDVSERTLVLFPEGLFRKTDGTYAELAHAGGAWTLDGEALDAAHQTLLGLSVWFWRGYFPRPTRMFRGGHGDAGKNIESVTFQAMMHPDMPDGHRLYTLGDPAAADIDLSGGS